MTEARDYSGARTLLTVNLAQEPDLVLARKRARQLARLLGFDHQDQVRIATATSEIARNAVQYAKGGKVEFSVDLEGLPPAFIVLVSDRGPGIGEVDEILEGRYRSQTGMGCGIAGTRRLMDRFAIESSPGTGTSVRFGKALPFRSPRLRVSDLGPIVDQLAREGPQSAYDELRNQNQELLSALDTVRAREAELARRQSDLARLNQELEETNRGVLALYAELDEKAAALHKANEVKTRFLSHMSHEFRTPLNSILALSDLLKREVDGGLSAAQHKQVGYVRSAAEELFEMVNDLLDLAKVEAGKVEIHAGLVEVPQLLGALRGMLRPLLNSDAVALTFDEAPPGLALLTDEGKLAQILRNLVSNALKFTERGEIRVTATQKMNRVIFSVSDTGIGISPQDQERIFHDFMQVEHPLQKRVKGTGLGLPLSRKLAELLGGTLTVKSEVGVGSTFIVDLPGAQTPSETLDALTDAKGDFEQASPGSILVIDDEEVSRYLVRQLFRGTKYRLIEASGGAEGAERARFEQPVMILLDLTMPDRNGYEVLDDLKEDPATRDIPVVIHTSRMILPDDLARLGGRQAAILSKRPEESAEAFSSIRQLLGEPGLFSVKEGIQGS